MTSETHRQRPRRVLVPFDTADRDAAALEDAARLAAALEAELVGLFIEDTDVLDAAGLPFTRLVSSQSRSPSAFDAAAIQRALRICSADLRRALEAAAERWSLRWSFHVARGTPAERLLALAGESDLLAYRTDRRSRRARETHSAKLVAAQARCSVFLIERRPAAGRPVVVLFEAAEPAVAVGHALAGINNIGLAVLALGADHDAAEAAAAAARAALPEDRRNSDVVALPGADAGRIAAALEDRHAGIVIFERRGAFASAIEQALDSIDCSVLVVG